METPAHIGPSIAIKGEISAREPLTIAGKVDGSIAVEGHSVTILAGSQVSAAVSAETIVVAGAVSGSLAAAVRVVVGQTASIEGDVSAPAVSVADGAMLHGRIQTGERKKGLALAS